MPQYFAIFQEKKTCLTETDKRFSAMFLRALETVACTPNFNILQWNFFIKAREYTSVLTDGFPWALDKFWRDVSVVILLANVRKFSQRKFDLCRQAHSCQSQWWLDLGDPLSFIAKYCCFSSRCGCIHNHVHAPVHLRCRKTLIPDFFNWVIMQFFFRGLVNRHKRGQAWRLRQTANSRQLRVTKVWRFTFFNLSNSFEKLLDISS